MLAKLTLFCVVAILLSGGALRGDTIYVPDDEATIQDAINAAAAGDEIVVRAGTYYENLRFLGKAITLRSEDGPDETVIDGRFAWSVVQFVDSEESDSVLSGFTLTNGVRMSGPTAGAGVFCYESSPTIVGNVIFDNAGNYGSGIGCNRAAPTIIDNQIIGNRAQDVGGGITCLDNSSPLIKQNLIIDNFAYSFGGSGVHCGNSSPTIVGNTITGNQSAEDFGSIGCFDNSAPVISKNEIVDNLLSGIYTFGSSPTITGNLIARNESEERGGAIFCNSSSPTIRDNVISENVSKSDGGGLCILDSSPMVIANNVICANESWNGDGGGLFVYGSDPTLINNTFFGNLARSNGGGCDLNDSVVTISNTIFWGNQAQSGKEIFVNNSGTVDISYSDVDGGQDSIGIHGGGVLNWGAGMIDADPLFVDAPSGDFHLTLQSPCANSGDAGASGLPTEDFEGDRRDAFGGVDMGADEFDYHLYYVTVDDVYPGGILMVRIIGLPGRKTKLVMGSGVIDPPLPTIYGDLYLESPLKLFPLGDIPSNGVLELPVLVPLWWQPGEEYPFQALVGGLGWPSSRLTNLVVLKVE